MSAGHLPAMSNAAFAGFLRLLLTPLNETPDPSQELEAYLDYLRTAEARQKSSRHPVAVTAGGERVAVIPM